VKILITPSLEEFKTFSFLKVQEVIEIVILSLLSFLIPILIGHPQVIVGILVNAFITRITLVSKGKRYLPVILFPALGALVRGVLFGSFTLYLVYLLPFIWMSNYILVFVIKNSIRRKVSFSVAVFMSSFLKAGALFIPTVVLFQLSVIPRIFLTNMGIIQFFTALIGVTGAFFITRLEGSFKKGNL
jgi:hypothetical protein